MYVIYCDGSPIYSPNFIQHGYAIISGKITKELNKAGSLEFTIPKTNPMYSQILKLKSTITVEDYGKEIWRGRVLDERRDFYGNKTFLCEGELAYLNDSYSDPGTNINETPQTILTACMNRYAITASPYRSIKMGEIHNWDSSKTVNLEVSESNDLLSWLMNLLIDTIGGYLIIERRNGQSYLDYYGDFNDRISDQIIEFGKNLIDFEEYVNAADIYTYLIPLGKKDENGNRVNISSVNGGNNYIFSSSGENLYGKIWKIIVWEDQENPSSLLAKGKEELENAIEAATTITMNAVDLKDLGVDVSKIDIGWMYPVISVPHGLSSNFLCSKLTLDLKNRGNNEYVLGFDSKSLTEKQARNSKKIDSTSSSLNSQKTNEKELRDRLRELEKGLGDYGSSQEDILKEIREIKEKLMGGNT